MVPAICHRFQLTVEAIEIEAIEIEAIEIKTIEIETIEFEMSMQRGAVLDPTQSYRYALWRVWNPTAPKVGFVMLNPSRADASVDDSTIRRCLGFARSWNYGALEVVNLFAYRTAHPKDLRSSPEPVGAENDRYLVSLGDRVDRIILAWGNWGRLQGRDRAVLEMLTTQDLYCLGLTQTQQPRHPLYLRRDVVPMSFSKDC